MNLFAALRQRRQPAQGFGNANSSAEIDRHQTFILEPILTPSGFVDVGEDLPEVADLDIDLGLDAEDGFDPVDTDLLDGDDLADADLEDIPFIENLDVDFQFESGYFTVGESGEVTIDYLFDGGKYQGELAIFSLDGMEDLEPGSEAFIQMAANRALSESELGYIVISDQTEGARFSGELGEQDWNRGDYLGAKTFQMKPGDRFGFMLVPKGEVAEVVDNPGIGGAKTPLFSLATANPDAMFHAGQIADVTGDGNTFVFEDLRVDGKSDLDYNDLIFQVRGAEARNVMRVEDITGAPPVWMETDLGEAIIAHALPDLPPVDYRFDDAAQPLVGVLDTGLNGNNPDLDYSRILLGKDWVGGDDNPLLELGETDEHGTQTLGLIGATQDNDLGIDGINDDAPLWVGRAVGSGQWSDSLVEFVDAAQASGQPNAVVNLSFDLTQVDAEGNVTTRYELTPEEQSAIEYARQNGVLIVAAAGNDGGVMSALGQASQLFDNIITVGAANGLERADFSSYGYGLDLLADGFAIALTGETVDFAQGTSVAAARVTGAASQVWAANPDLSYRQVIELLKSTAQDVEVPGWDVESGFGLLNMAAAVQLAKVTAGQTYGTPAISPTDTWSGAGVATPQERAAAPQFAGHQITGNAGVTASRRRPYVIRRGDTLWAISQRELGSGYRWREITKDSGGRHSFTSAEARRLRIGQVVYLPVKQQVGTGWPILRPPVGRPRSFVLRPGRQNLRFYRGQRWVTASGYTFVFQRDGNLVLYTPQGKAIWATGTNGSNAHRLAVQTDGNVVLYDSKNKPLWATDTAGNSGAYFAIQGDGHLVVYSSKGKAIYASGTNGGKRQTLSASAQWLNKGKPKPGGRPAPVMSLGQFDQWRNRPEYTSRNPFPYKGMNCTWYAHGRMLQLGYSEYALDSMRGNAHEWNNTASRGARVVNSPQVPCIALWEAYVGGALGAGHVAVVERVNADGSILISESNWNGQRYGTRTIRPGTRSWPSKFITVPRA